MLWIVDRASQAWLASAVGMERKGCFLRFFNDFNPSSLGRDVEILYKKEKVIFLDYPKKKKS